MTCPIRVVSYAQSPLTSLAKLPELSASSIARTGAESSLAFQDDQIIALFAHWDKTQFPGFRRHPQRQPRLGFTRRYRRGDLEMAAQLPHVAGNPPRRDFRAPPAPGPAPAARPNQARDWQSVPRAAPGRRCSAAPADCRAARPSPSSQRAKFTITARRRLSARAPPPGCTRRPCDRTDARPPRAPGPRAARRAPPGCCE